MAGSGWQQLIGGLVRVTYDQLTKRSTMPRRPSRPRSARSAGAPALQPSPRPRAEPSGSPAAPGSDLPSYPGDFAGEPPWAYEPKVDGLPDPGEVVWAWVPYEEDNAQGKDRPALVIGRDGPWLLAMPLTSKDHDRDAEQEARAGRFWVDIGSGAWDRSGRASEARVDRVVRLDPARVRREGAALSREVFDLVVAERLTAYRAEGSR